MTLTAPAPTFDCPTCDEFPFDTADELAAHRCRLTRVTATPTTSGRFETVPNGFGGTTTRRRTAVVGPTEKQAAFARSLLTERAGIEDAEAIRRELNTRREAGTLGKRDMSDAIERLLAIPRPRRAAAAPTDTPAVPAGRYAIDSADGLRFYRVDHGKGRWEGRTFVQVQASDDLHPVRNAGQRAAILAAIAVDPTAAMLRYGQEIGACGHCGRTLTDEASRARGIGPVCAGRI